MKKRIAAAATALALVGGGSAVVADNQIDPYTEKAETFEVQIEGETVEISKDKPEIKLNRWGGEESLTVKKSGNYGKAKRGLFSRQQKWQKGKESIIVEPLKKGENLVSADTGGEEGFKIDILLDKKPNTNVFTLEMEGWEDLDFWYQSPLTPEQIARGDTRPENVIGSYAVYHKLKRDHVEGETNYYTGKLFHIYRPKVLDANGNWVWGEMSYTGGILSVTVPQTFLDNATYPVRVDPTFGYTSAGASAVNIANISADTSILWGNAASSTEDGAITQIDAYLDSPTTTETIDISVFVNLEDVSTDLHPQTLRISRSAVAVSTAEDWYSFTPSTTAAVTIDDYILSITGDGNDVALGSTVQLRHDNAGSRNQYFQNPSGAMSYYNNLENPLNENDGAGTSELFSIYATYTTCSSTPGTVCSIYFTTPGYSSWTAPAGVTTAYISAWGAGGGGGVVSGSAGGGGGGGAYASSTVTVVPGTSYTVSVGAGGTRDTTARAGTSSFATTTVAAQAGTSTGGTAAGIGGLAASSIGTTKANGGNGGVGNTTNDVGGGGGGAGGPDGAGAVGSSPGAGTVGGDGGQGNNSLGGLGGIGGNASVGGMGVSHINGGGGGGGGDDGFSGGQCGAPGAGGGGGEITAEAMNGCNGQVLIVYIVPDTSASSNGGALQIQGNLDMRGNLQIR